MEEGSSNTGKSNNNPTGINQFKDCPPKNDEQTAALITGYHKRGITGKLQISELLAEEHDIKMSQRTVARRLKDLGLKGSGATTREMPLPQKRQLVLDQLAVDPSSRRGPRMIKEYITHDTGLHLTRDFIEQEMRIHDPDGFAVRLPTAKKISRRPIVCLGPHHEWSADGHDKLAKIGFPIWGVRDVWGGKWLGLWVVPNNRLKLAVAYLYLQLVEELGGMSVQMTTDCGSETTEIFGLANALREAFSPHLIDPGGSNVLPAHRFMKSVHNITIERGWLRLRLQWGDNVKVFWEAGSGVYDATNHHQYELVQWLWSKLIQQELDHLRSTFNDHKVRRNKEKLGPSGVSPNIATALYAKYGGEWGLQPVDVNVVRQLKEELGGEDLVRFVPAEYATHAQTIYDSLGIESLEFNNVWNIFTLMLPLI
ncbi:hypothetical protein QCA50_005905 [Cerrena zonata]|uniref:Integrase core domain-containing protein n=1 Tax=Cerrena zonata TaxID=2478898 RepID=A0AAW0GNN6_9APHY